MKVKDIINQSVTVIKGGVNGYIGQTNISMKDVLFTLSRSNSDRVNTARVILNNKGDEPYKQYKQTLPVWFPSGCIALRDSTDKNMVSHTNIIALDIDHLSEDDMQRFRSDFYNKPYVVAILQSTSGKGLYVLIYVEDWQYTKGYYRYFGRLLKHLYNIDLDMNATNIARKRFISWEDKMENWIKPMDSDIEPWKLYLEEKEESKSQTTYQPMTRTSFEEDPDWEKEQTHKAMWALLNDGFNEDDYRRWFYHGCDFAAFPDGELLFNKLCENWEKTNGKTQDPKAKYITWNECMKHSSIINDDLHRKWQGMAKNRLGPGWWRESEQLTIDFTVDQPPI